MSFKPDLDAAAIVALERSHAQLLDICLTLEEIADTIFLPLLDARKKR